MQMEAIAGNDGRARMLARCLGYLILELSRISDEARDIVAHEVVACVADFEMMAELAQVYIDHLIRLCESYFAFTNMPTRAPFIFTSPTKERTYPCPV
jgi:hypothetical protein